MTESKNTSHIFLSLVFLSFVIFFLLLIAFVVNLNSRLNIRIDNLAPQLVPTGTIIHYASATAPGELEADVLKDYLYCDGRILDQTDERYKKLYDLIGDTWWEELTDDEKNNEKIAAIDKPFRIPNLNNQFLRGAGVENSVGNKENWATALPSGPKSNGESRAIIASLSGEHKHTTEKSKENEHDGTHIHVDNSTKSSISPGFKGLIKVSENSDGAVTTKGFDGDKNSEKNKWDNSNNRRELNLAEVFPLSGGGHSHSISEGGNHTHTLTGGDEETRPMNKRVAFFIKL